MRAAASPGGEGQMFSLVSGRLCPVGEEAPSGAGTRVGIYPARRLEEEARRLGLPDTLAEEFSAHRTTRFEGHTGYDAIFLHVPDSASLHGRRHNILLYLDGKTLLVFTDSAGVLSWLLQYAGEAEGCCVDRLLYDLFKFLIRQDSPGSPVWRTRSASWRPPCWRAGRRTMCAGSPTSAGTCGS